MIGKKYQNLFYTAILFAGILFFWTSEVNAGIVAAYPKFPDTPLSSTYTMTVDGQNVPVSTYQGHSFVWFAFSGTANVKVTVNATVSSHQLSPRSYNIPTSVSGSDISFTLNQPRKLVLRKVNGMSEELFIFADAPESGVPTLGSSGVFNGASSVQSAIDSASSYPGGGVAYLPAGSYSGATMKSNVNLYLAPGAVLRGLTVRSTTNSKITGRGYYCCAKMQVYYNTNFHIHDIVIVASPTTALRTGFMLNSGVHNIKIITGRTFDGMDTEGVFNYIIEDSFIWSGDDNIAVGSGAGDVDFRKPSNTDGLIIRNNVLKHTATGRNVALFGGHIGHQYVRNVLVENNNGISSETPVEIQAGNGAPLLSGFTIRNNHFEDIRGKYLGIHSMDFFAWGGCGNGSISHTTGAAKNILFDNNYFYSSVGSGIISGYSPTQNIDNVIINNWYINGVKATSLSTAKISLGPYVTNVRVTTDASPLPIMPALPKSSIMLTLADYQIDPSCGSINLPAWPDPAYQISSIFFPGGTGPTTTSTPTPSPSGTLKGDLNNDRIVNSLDWSIMNSRWFSSDSTADLNSDGIVNSLDFSIMNGNWLKSV